MKVTIDEMHIERLSGLRECCACISYNAPGDKDLSVKPELFGLFYSILDDAIESVGKVIPEEEESPEKLPEIEGLKEVHKPNLKPLKRL